MSQGDYPGSTFYGAHANNHTKANRPSSNPIERIVIHVAQGSYWGTLNWFTDTRSRASAHYTVSSERGLVGQSVREKDIGWHAGNWPYNQTSIGIEHEGFVSNQAWFTTAMYNASAKLTAHLCKKYRIPVDRRRIIGHNEVPGCSYSGGGGAGCHTDPGRYWNWTHYMNRVRHYHGSTTTRYVQVVDNAQTGRFRAANVWKTSRWSSQRRGADYVYTNPGSRASNARFKVRIPSRGRYRVFGWWPADRGYNDRTVFRVYTVNGWVRRVVNQRRNGGKWVLLGTYTMPRGDDFWVQVSNRSAGKGYIIADAVRIVRV